MTRGDSKPRPARPEAIYFDAAGTLFQVSHPVGAVYAAVAREFGWDLPPDEVGRTFAEVFRTLPLPEAEGGEADPEREWWRRLVLQVLERNGVRPACDEFDEYFGRLWNHYAGAAAWSVFPEVPEVLEFLAKDHRLGIISNFDGRLAGIMEGLGLRGYFDTITVSGQVGARKPSGAIFAAALVGHGLSTGENAVHVGDDPGTDWEGARAAGLAWYELKRPGRDLRDFQRWLTGQSFGGALTWREISLTFFAASTT